MSCRYSRKRRGNKAVLSRPEGAARSPQHHCLEAGLLLAGWLWLAGRPLTRTSCSHLSQTLTTYHSCPHLLALSLFFPSSFSLLHPLVLSLSLSSLPLSPYLTLSLVAPLYEPLPSSLSPAFFGAAPARAVLCLPTDTTTTACPAPPRSLPRPSPPHGDTHSHPPHTPRQHYTRTHSDSAHSTLHP